MKALEAVVEGEMGTGWKVVKGWKACPIGALPGGKVAGLDL